MSAWTRLWRDLFDPDELESFGQRIQGLMLELVVVVRSLQELWGWAEVIPHQPGITKPTGIARFVDISFLLHGPAAAINAALTGVFLLLGLTGRFRFAYLVAFVLFHLEYVARFGMSRVQHKSSVLGFTVLAFALSHVAFRSPALRRKASRGLIVLALGGVYALAALTKLVITGPGWVDGRNLWIWVTEARLDGLASGGRSHLNFVQKLILEHHWFATAMLTGGLLAECGGALLWWRPVQRWILLALVGMHVGIYAVLGIPFWSNVLVLLCLALPIAEVIDHLRARRNGAVSFS